MSGSQEQPKETKLDHVVAKVDEMHEVLLGNGHPERSLVTRVMICEGKIKLGMIIVGTVASLIATAAFAAMVAGN